MYQIATPLLMINVVLHVQCLRADLVTNIQSITTLTCIAIWYTMVYYYSILYYEVLYY